MRKTRTAKERNIQGYGNNYTSPWTDDVPEMLEMKLIVIDDVSVKFYCMRNNEIFIVCVYTCTKYHFVDLHINFYAFFRYNIISILLFNLYYFILSYYLFYV